MEIWKLMCPHLNETHLYFICAYGLLHFFFAQKTQPVTFQGTQFVEVLKVSKSNCSVISLVWNIIRAG